jgi:hypothetical protein
VLEREAQAVKSPHHDGVAGAQCFHHTDIRRFMTPPIFVSERSVFGTGRQRLI